MYGTIKRHLQKKEGMNNMALTDLFKEAGDRVGEFTEQSERKDIVNRLKEYLGEFGIAEKDFKEELDYFKNDIHGFKSILFDTAYPEHIFKWIIMPIKMLNPDYVNEYYDEQKSRFSSGTSDYQEKNLYQYHPTLFEIQDMMLEKAKFYEENQRLLIHMKEEFLEADYFEKIALKSNNYQMTSSILKEISNDMEGYEDALKYYIESCPIEEIEGLEELEKEDFVELILSYTDIIKRFFDINREQLYDEKSTIVGKDIRYLFPLFRNIYITPDVLENYLQFVLAEDEEEIQTLKLQIAPVISRAINEDALVTEMLKFTSNLKSIPHSFLIYLSEHQGEMDEELSAVFRDAIAKDHESFFEQLCTNEKYQNEDIYSLLSNTYYQMFTDKQQEVIRNVMLEMDENSWGRIYEDIFESQKIDISYLSEDALRKTFHYLNVSSKEDYEMRKASLQNVEDQMTTSLLNEYFDRYLWYLDNSDLRTKEEYNAHGNYFKNQKISTFFQPLSFCDDSYQEELGKRESSFYRMLRMVTDNEEKKEEQLEFIRTLGDKNLSDEMMDAIVKTFEFSEDTSALHHIVELTSNPLFAKLDEKIQKQFIDSYLLEPYQAQVEDLDILAEDYHKLVTLLDEDQYIKCRGYNHDGEKVDVYVKKKMK